MAKFNIISRGGYYYFQFMANNGEQIIASEAYTTKFNCQNGIAAVKKAAPYDSNYRRTDNYMNYRFTMVGGNYETIARSSEGYTTSANRENAIRVVKDYAPAAPTYDLT